MTMISFRLPDGDAAQLSEWANRLGVERSELLREALRRHLNSLHSAEDADRWESEPATEAEMSLAAISDWGPADDWSDWQDDEAG